MRGNGIELDWPQLSRIELKADLYDRETYFREGYRDFLRASTQAGADPTSVVSATALLIVKPDGLQHGVTGSIVEALGSWGFEVAWATRVDLGGQIWRELWRYQLTIASLRRLEFNDALYRYPGLLLVLHRQQAGLIPASVDLSSRKGSATLADQTPDSLRARLGQPHRVLSLIHVADEPADVIREFGLCLDRSSRIAAVTAVAGGQRLDTQDVIRCAARLHDGRPPGLPTAAEAEDRLRALLTKTDDTAASQLLVLLDEAPKAGGLDWSRALSLMTQTTAALPPWDLIAAAANWLQPDEPGYTKLLVNVDSDDWHS